MKHVKYIESESESEFHLFDPHNTLTQYLNMIMF